MGLGNVITPRRVANGIGVTIFNAAFMLYVLRDEPRGWKPYLFVIRTTIVALGSGFWVAGHLSGSTRNRIRKSEKRGTTRQRCAR